MAIVLASQSPRRQELLQRIGVEDFKTLSLDIDGPSHSDKNIKFADGHGSIIRELGVPWSQFDGSLLFPRITARDYSNIKHKNCRKNVHDDHETH